MAWLGWVAAGVVVAVLGDALPAVVVFWGGAEVVAVESVVVLAGVVAWFGWDAALGAVAVVVWFGWVAAGAGFVGVPVSVVVAWFACGVLVVASAEAESEVEGGLARAGAEGE